MLGQSHANSIGASIVPMCHLVWFTIGRDSGLESFVASYATMLELRGHEGLAISVWSVAAGDHGSSQPASKGLLGQSPSDLAPVRPQETIVQLRWVKREKLSWTPRHFGTQLQNRTFSWKTYHAKSLRSLETQRLTKSMTLFGCWHRQLPTRLDFYFVWHAKGWDLSEFRNKSCL